MVVMGNGGVGWRRQSLTIGSQTGVGSTEIGQYQMNFGSRGFSATGTGSVTNDLTVYNGTGEIGTAYQIRGWHFTYRLVAACTTAGGDGLINKNDMFTATYQGSVFRSGSAAATASLIGSVVTVSTASNGGFVTYPPIINITATGSNLRLSWQSTGSSTTVIGVNYALDIVELGWA